MTYRLLEQRFREVGHLQEIEAIVEWDRAVNMPDAASDGRAGALAALAVVQHERLAAPKLGAWFEAARGESLDDWQSANLREMARLWRRQCAVDGRLVGALTEACARTEQAWRGARAENDFSTLLPFLEEVVSLKRQQGEALAEVLGGTPYDALMDEFEPGARSVEIDQLFSPLRVFLPGFTRRVLEKQPDTVALPDGPFPIEAQRLLGVGIMQQLGFDTRRGRLDVSHHPFCGGVPADVRITTRYSEKDFSSSLMGVLHEAGHGKYEQGLPANYRYQPVGLARGMVLHESQSLLQEMQVCRSREFIRFAAPRIRAAFPEQVARVPDAFREDNLARQALRVERSFIRVDADEVTYPSHVLLRYDIEKGLIDGSVRVSDIPELWDTKMTELLGLSTAGNDRDGCLQDVHWSSGAFGYFPLYTLGAMAAAQLFAAAIKDEPTLVEDIPRGDVSALDSWLLRNVWARGSFCDTQEVLRDATGSPLTPDAFVAHLERRYLPR